MIDKHEALAGSGPEFTDSGLLISWHSDSGQVGNQRGPTVDSKVCVGVGGRQHDLFLLHYSL